MDNSQFPIRVAELVKNARERVVIELSEFKSYRLVSVRVHALEGEKLVPTKAGLSIQVAQLPALVEALGQAVDQARKLGLIEGGAH